MGILEKFFGPPNIEKLKEKRDVEGLIRVLGEIDKADKDFRFELHARNAAKALGELKDARAVEPLIAALKKRKGFGDLEMAIVVALGQIGDKRAVEPLVSVLKSGFVFDEQAVGYALGGLADRDVVQRVIDGVKREEIRQFALVGLAEGAAASGNDRVVEPLIDAVEEKGMVSLTTARQEAVRALSVLRDPRALNVLVRMLKDGQGVLKELAAQALGKLGDRRAVEPLIGALGRKDCGADLKYHVAQALGRLGDARAISYLIPLLGHPVFHSVTGPTWDVAGAAAQALETIGGPEVERGLAEYRVRQK